MIKLKFELQIYFIFIDKWLPNCVMYFWIGFLLISNNVFALRHYIQSEDAKQSALPVDINLNAPNSGGLVVAVVDDDYDIYEDEKEDDTEYFYADHEEYEKDESAFSGRGGIIADYIPEGNDQIPQMINRVIGGRPADRDSFPYIVSIRYGIGSTHICGGAILSPTWILTAAHCVKKETPESYRIQLNQNNKKNQISGSNLYSVVEILHPDRRSEYSDDIALLKLSRPIRLNNRITVVQLPSSPASPGTTVTVAGWGAIGRKRPKVLMTADFPLRTYSDCRKVFRKAFIDGMLCAGIKGVDACPGDSGGPLVTRGTIPSQDVVIGVVSWGPECGTSFGVYTDIWHYRSWIEANTDLDNPYDPNKFPWSRNERQKHPGRFWISKLRPDGANTWSDNPITRMINKVREATSKKPDHNSTDNTDATDITDNIDITDNADSTDNIDSNANDDNDDTEASLDDANQEGSGQDAE